MMTVKEVSDLTGVSIRTLHYYDQLGLLPAAGHTDSGYRLYDDAALERLQQILLFRELEFPLKDIQRILTNSAFDRRKALAQQIELLTLKKQHLESLISLAQKTLTTGGTYMDFTAFDTQKIQEYTRQAKQQWGATSAYKEFEQKTAHQTAQEAANMGGRLMEILAVFGGMQHKSPAAPAVQTQVKALQAFITEHYYTCTKEIFAQLGQMYGAGGAFAENINAAGGPGTAEFAAKAIEVYCQQ
ncbi:MerR family transcriptional regulator [Gemmiger sp.]